MTEPKKRVDALVKPELLLWARETLGLNQELAAKKLAIKTERLQDWESGKSTPTFPQLINMAEVYKRPLAAFYLQSPPVEARVPHDFRKLPDKSAATYSPQLRVEIRKAQRRRQIAIELWNNTDESPAEVPVLASPNASASDFAPQVRNYLGVSIEQQIKFASEYEALNGWRAAIESKGILVCQAPKIPVEEMRGLSINSRPLPLILLNSADSVYGRVFTLIHELAHILTGDEGVCTLSGGEIEVFCNEVAGSVLVPKEYLLQEVQKVGFQEEGIQILSNKLKVSREVVLHRLNKLGVLPKDLFNHLLALYRSQTPNKDSKESSGGPRPHVMAVAYAGKLFSRLVLKNYYNEKITAAEVSDYLATKIKYIAEIDTSVFK